MDWKLYVSEFIMEVVVCINFLGEWCVFCSVIMMFLCFVIIVLLFEKKM